MACSCHQSCGESSNLNVWHGLQLGCWSLVCFCMLGWHTLAMAADNKPNAGGLFLDIPAPTKSKEKNQEIKGLENLQEKAQAGPDVFEVSQLIINGNTVFSKEQLHALVKSLEGTSMTLQQLETGIEKITDFYRSNGYPLARALVPDQVIEEGAVQIFILEAVWGNVQIVNTSQVSDQVLERVLGEIQPGQQVQQAQIDTVSLMLSDIHGVDPHFTIKRGQVTGSSDLEVQAKAETPLNAQIMYDNHGSKYTGRDRTYLGLQWNNPFRQGDLIDIKWLSTGDLLNYKRISFEAPLAYPGWVAGTAVSNLQYTLGDVASTTNSTGSVRQRGFWGKYQLQRSQTRNMAMKLNVDHMVLEDHQGSGAIQTDRTIHAVNVSLNADKLDAWMGGGQTIWNAQLTVGELDFDDAAAEKLNDKSAKHKGKFEHLRFSAYRQQFIHPTTTLLLSVDSQWGLTNLDSSHKFYLGGPRSVRAYESGTLSGDSGMFFGAELSQLLPEPPPHLNLRGQWFATLFIEAGKATINQRPWDTGTNEESLSGIGVGFNWTGPDNWRAALSWARPLHPAPGAYANSKRVSAAFELTKGFR